MIDSIISGIMTFLFIVLCLQFYKFANWVDISLFLEKIDKENGFEFEAEISQIFIEAGITHFVTKKTRDGGVDIETEKCVIQVKRYAAKKIPLKVIEELSITAQKAEKRGVLITNYILAKEAEKKALHCNIVVIDREKLIKVYFEPEKLKEYIEYI